MSRFKCFDEDHVAVGVVREHYVVVAAARADGEAAHVVSVELADGFHDDKQFVGALGRELTGDVGGGTSAAGLGLVERVPCLDWVMWPRIVSTETGQYLAALAKVRPGQVE